MYSIVAFSCLSTYKVQSAKIPLNSNAVIRKGVRLLQPILEREERLPPGILIGLPVIIVTLSGNSLCNQPISYPAAL